jgi:hypothetical protein
MICTEELREPEVASAAEPDARLRWYREVLLAGAFYLIYSFVRNQFGSATVEPSRAFTNAMHVIHIEKALHLFVEAQVQQAFLGWTFVLRVCNIFYGTFHFVVTGGAMIFLYRRAPARYRKWRTVLACTTGVALVGFSFFPLMPPRLLGDFGQFGGKSMGYHFVDTLSRVGGLWSFESHGMVPISNQYAAMPSLHVAWAMWCALAVAPMLTRRASRVLFACYPFVTLFAVVVTANHYWLDGVGGLVVLAVGYGLATSLDGLRTQRRAVTSSL